MPDMPVNDVFEDEIPPDEVVEGAPIEEVPEEQVTNPIVVTIEQFPQLEGAAIGDVLPMRIIDITDEGKIELDLVPPEGIGELPLEGEEGAGIDELSARLT